MFRKIFLFALLVFMTLAIQKSSTSHLKSGENHDFLGFGKPNNPKNRTEK
jgi:hypothetical protein